MFDLNDVLICIRDVRFLFHCDRTKRYISTCVVREGDIVTVHTRHAVGEHGCLTKPWMPYSMDVRRADKVIIQEVSPEHFDHYFTKEESNVCRI